MKVWEIQGDFGIENLNLVETDDPEPGFGEVLVGVRACSLNFRDYQVVMGQYDTKMPLPRIPFSDGAGEVLAIGDGVEKFAVEDRVAGAFMQDWIAGDVSPEAAASALGGAIDGMLSEKIVLAEHGLVRVPEISRSRRPRRSRARRSRRGMASSRRAASKRATPFSRSGRAASPSSRSRLRTCSGRGQSSPLRATRSSTGRGASALRTA